MTLYLRVGVGGAAYLIAADGIASLADSAPGDGVAGAVIGGAVVDCRDLFGVPGGAPGYRVRLSPKVAEGLCLVVDRLEGMVELDDDAFRRLPPIGRMGTLFDAVTAPAAAEPPALRLNLGSALLTGAYISRGESDGRPGDAADC
ncbi:MAG TPA: hypothetical protein VG651_09430 [Stellaceae bacterium]|nr:hypothetical protein [Stellaceae bacterium]